MFNRKSSHYSGTGIASARKNKYGKMWYGTNNLEFLNKSNSIIIAGKEVQLSARWHKFDGQLVPMPAEPALRSKYKAALTCGNWRRALRIAMENFERLNGFSRRWPVGFY